MSKLLYFSPSWSGGLADYAVEQANALSTIGNVSVELLAPPEFRTNGYERYSMTRILNSSPNNLVRRSRLQSRINTARTITKNINVLIKHIIDQNYKYVLFGSYSEYLAPFWAGRLVKLARGGVVFGSIIHDPVRDYIVGPLWWHRWSVAQGYSFLREAFVHEELNLNTIRPMPMLRITPIPHGPYRFAQPTESRMSVREKLRVPEFAHVVLSFGHIRDGKNLDLAIRAMASLPSIYLVVAGREQSPGQKPIGYYQEIARSLRVDDRCRWIHGYIPEEEIGNLFLASDVALLTYSRDFRSASGVLNAAVCYRTPCLASSGGSNLRTVVEKYNLGWFIEPDDLSTLKRGLEMSIHCPVYPQWSAYESENSWERNALIVKERMFSH